MKEQLYITISREYYPSEYTKLYRYTIYDRIELFGKVGLYPKHTFDLPPEIDWGDTLNHIVNSINLKCFTSENEITNATKSEANYSNIGVPKNLTLLYYICVLDKTDKGLKLVESYRVKEGE